MLYSSNTVTAVLFSFPFTHQHMLCFPSADFSILYIQSFVYTVYDELAGRRQGPEPSGKSAASFRSHITTTETNTGEPLHT